jgi:ABC-2 type transport system ATP-binding protein
MTLTVVHPLVCEDVAKRYGATVALEGLQLVVRNGTIWGLVGPNGSGKTTAVGCIAGLLSADRGCVLLAGEDLRQPQSRRHLAFVPDEPQGLDELTVAEFLELLQALHHAPHGFEARAERLLALLPLARRRHVRLGALSRGLRRQVSVVGALALATPLLVVDEATAALDPEAVVVLREGLAAAAARGAGVLLATQDLDFAERVCDGVTLLREGTTVTAGLLPEVLGRYGARSLEAAFLAAVGEPELAREVREALDAH